MELVILNLGTKSIVGLNKVIDKTLEKCNEFYKRMCSTHNKCQVSVDTQVPYFPTRYQHLKNLQDRLQTGEESISKIKSIGEESIGVWIVQALVHKHLFEDLLIQRSPKLREIESQLSKHEIDARVLEPVDYRVISEESQAWGVFIKKPVGPT